MQNTPSPFQQGKYLARFLFEEGVFDRGMLLIERDRCREEAQRYARYAAPGGTPETIRTIAAGLLYQWVWECEHIL